MRRGRTPPNASARSAPLYNMVPSMPRHGQPFLWPQPLALVLPLASPGGLQCHVSPRLAPEMAGPSSTPALCLGNARPGFSTPFVGRRLGEKGTLVSRGLCSYCCLQPCFCDAEGSPVGGQRRGLLGSSSQAMHLWSDLAACPRILPCFQKLPIQESLKDTWIWKCELNKMTSLTLMHYSLYSKCPQYPPRSPLQTCLQRASVFGSEITI